MQCQYHNTPRGMFTESYYVDNDLPEPDTTDLNLDAPCAGFGWPNLISNVVSSRHIYFPEHEGPLSIKCSFGGGQVYETCDGVYEIDDRSYLLLNNGQRYSTLVPEGKPINSFTIFFRPGFAESVLRTLQTPSDRQLDDPEFAARAGASDDPVVFLERPYRHDNLLSPLLFSLKAATSSRRVDAVLLGEQFHTLLEKMLVAHHQVWRDVERLPAVKRSTRVEVYRRLQRAKEYIDDSYALALTLPEIASIACMSPHHFLRSFKGLFNVTPHQYVMRRRLEIAQTLLKTTDLSVSAICYDVGFESPSSFSWLFRRKIGISPEQFRLSAGRSGSHGSSMHQRREPTVHRHT